MDFQVFHVIILVVEKAKFEAGIIPNLLIIYFYNRTKQKFQPSLSQGNVFCRNLNKTLKFEEDYGSKNIEFRIECK